LGSEFFSASQKYMLLAGIINSAEGCKTIDKRREIILKEMASCDDVLCRLAVCGCVSNYEMFLDDEDMSSQFSYV